MTKYIFIFLCFIFSTNFHEPVWGFFGHRRINRMAVFTLPQEMIGFYKKHIEFITEHAIDPDKRRYATKHEGVRHYIDIDHWGKYPFDEVPRDYGLAILDYSESYILRSDGDTSFYNFRDIDMKINGIEGFRDSLSFYIKNKALNAPDEMPWAVDLNKYGVSDTLYVRDNFSEYGILPYWLLRYQRRLVGAFKQKDGKRILRISAEMGHYISDAHVPLHTTENYNGGMTDQVGIHAFWESRIPELFADEEFDYFVGKAKYIKNTKKFYWEVVLKSHELLSDVLKFEKELSAEFPSDKQWCYDDRLNRTIRIQCPDYAQAYRNKMSGMVEKRMRESIHSVASIWYTAWVEAGQPDLDNIDKIMTTEKEKKEEEALNQQYKSNQILGRSHDEGRN